MRMEHKGTIRIETDRLVLKRHVLDDAEIMFKNWDVYKRQAQSRKIHTEPEWAWSLADQAHKLGIPVIMKEDLVPIIGDENMIQEMPEEVNKVLEVQKSWRK